MTIGKKAWAKITQVDKPWLSEEDLEPFYLGDIIMKEKWYDPYIDEQESWLEDLEGDRDDPLTSHIDDPGSTSRKVYHPPGNEWPAVINSTNHTLSIQKISHTDTTIEWECLVRTANAVRFECFSISSPLPLPVVGCFTTTGFWVTDPAHGGKITDASGNFVPELDSLLDLDRLVDELCFITLQILEGRYEGPHRRDVVG